MPPATKRKPSVEAKGASITVFAGQTKGRFHGDKAHKTFKEK